MARERVPIYSERGPLDLSFGALQLEQFLNLRWPMLVAIDHDTYDELCRRFPAYNIDSLKYGFGLQRQNSGALDGKDESCC